MVAVVVVVGVAVAVAMKRAKAVAVAPRCSQQLPSHPNVAFDIYGGGGG